jgi:murein DD-endopeptidase MepM/ murein hydrolase activator NlpD
VISAKRTILVSLFALFIAFSAWPQHPAIPVVNATPRDWNPRSFWFEPWGASGVHKGIDIFAGEGTPVVSPVPGIVVFSGSLGRGGNAVAVLTTQWRLHYFAHLKRIDSGFGKPVATGTPLGTVGTTGNAAGKAPHLHYSVLTLMPYPWRWDGSTQGWKKMFFLDPAAVLNGTSRGV